MAVTQVSNMGSILQPAGGGTPVYSPPAPAPAPAPTTTTTKSTYVAPKTVSTRNFSDKYGIYQGTVYDKATNQPFSSDADFKAVTGYSSAGAIFDTAYKPVIYPQGSQQPATASELERGSVLPDPTTFTFQQGADLSTKITQVANATLTSVQSTLDALLKDQEDTLNAEKIVAERRQKELEGKLEDMTDDTIYQDALKAIDKKFQIKAKIDQYSQISQRIVDAQEALNLGLVYEGGRPARMQLINGRTAQLRAQGLAVIGAMQGTAAVLKGGIDLAYAYGNATIQALKDDTARQTAALSTLLDLNSKKLVSLTEREQATIDARLTMIKERIDTLDKNKDDIMDMMIKFPDAFLKGNVNLLDSKESAYQKMLPHIAERDRIEWNLTIAAKQASGKAGSSAASAKAVTAAEKSQILQLKAAGATYDEVVMAYGNTVDIKYIADVFGRSVVPSGTTNSADLYGNFINPDGTPKAGYSVGLDKKGQPIIQAVKPASTGSSWSLPKVKDDAKWYNPFSWF